MKRYVSFAVLALLGLVDARAYYEPEVQVTIDGRYGDPIYTNGGLIKDKIFRRGGPVNSYTQNADVQAYNTLPANEFHPYHEEQYDLQRYRQGSQPRSNSRAQALKNKEGKTNKYITTYYAEEEPSVQAAMQRARYGHRGEEPSDYTHHHGHSDEYLDV